MRSEWEANQQLANRQVPSWMNPAPRKYRKIHWMRKILILICGF